MSESLIQPPQEDGFTTESPLRAFTEFTVKGRYAVGRGFRPAAAHLTLYLDAIETKEHWQLVQLVLDDHGKPSAAIFRKASVLEAYRGAFPEIAKGFLVGQSATYRPSKGLLRPHDGEHNVPLNEVCQAVQHSDQMACKPCGQVWDINDPSAPDCKPANERDDPVNPKHYNGTACAEIGERLTPNAYQTLKYCWRLGEKDDPVIELGKAIWYWKREIKLRSLGDPFPVYYIDLPDDFDLESRIEDRSDFTRNVARMMWTGYARGMGAKHHQAILGTLEEELSLLEEELFLRERNGE